MNSNYTTLILTNAYDTQRSDVNLWRGKAINSLQDITMLLG